MVHALTKLWASFEICHQKINGTITVELLMKYYYRERHPSKSKTKINKSNSNAFQKHEHISTFPNVLFAKTDKNQF